MYDSIIKGKYHQKYFDKHHTLPNYFDSLGRMPFDYQEEILRQALEKGITWQELTKQKHSDLVG